MVEKIRIYKGSNGMSKAQKIRFIEFCLKIFTHEIKIITDEEDLSDYGFCTAYIYYFDESSSDFNLIPELRKYKPKIFYNWLGDISEFSNEFWHPPKNNIARMRICKAVLRDLKSRN